MKTKEIINKLTKEVESLETRVEVLEFINENRKYSTRPFYSFFNGGLEVSFLNTYKTKVIKEVLTLYPLSDFKTKELGDYLLIFIKLENGEKELYSVYTVINDKLTPVDVELYKKAMEVKE